MINKTWIASIAAVSLFAGAYAQAEVKVAPVISTNMVLQQDMADPIWGTAAANEQVNVEINGQKKTATAGADGKWMLKLDPMKAGGPFELKVGTTTIKNVLVGEVWHASGQSNMHFPLSQATNGADEVAKATDGQLHFANGKGTWTVCSPKTAAAYPAVAYYFAVGLRSKLNVPIGIIDTSVNGASCEQFISPEALAVDKPLDALVTQRKGLAPSDIYENSIKNLIPYGIKGVIWYQGEGDRDYPVTYQSLFPALIQDWRKEWGQGDFPFLFVQLANYQERKAVPWEGKDCGLREAQLKTLSVPNTAMAVSIDCAPANDPKYFKNPHYPNKKPVGDRLELAALALAYGEKIEYSGPLFESAKFDGDKAIVSFTHGEGLAAEGGGQLKGFLLAGADHKWLRADATIDGDKVVVKNAAIPNPVAVRYAWERNPECNLVNKAGLPASPFRSDTFEDFFTKDGE